MTRLQTVGSMKRATIKPGGIPKEGTKLRALYDKLLSGQPMHRESVSDSRRFQDLRDYYGVELETKKGRYGYIRMIGEWDGDEFVPLERMLLETSE